VLGVGPARQPAGKPADKIAPALKEVASSQARQPDLFRAHIRRRHMRAHPKQKVRQMSLLVEVEHIKEDDL
jgi:hypothetical protein